LRFVCLPRCLLLYTLQHFVLMVAPCLRRLSPVPCPVRPWQSAKEVVRDSVLPSLTDASVQHALSSATLDTHLLGFETGGEALH
jgi:hypothetical protein